MTDLLSTSAVTTAVRSPKTFLSARVTLSVATTLCDAEVLGSPDPTPLGIEAELTSTEGETVPAGRLVRPRSAGPRRQALLSVMAAYGGIDQHAETIEIPRVHQLLASISI